MNLQFSLRKLLGGVAVLALLMLWAASFNWSSVDYWGKHYLLTPLSERPSIVVGSMGLHRFPNKPCFGYIICDAETLPERLPPKQLVRTDHGSYFAGEPISCLEDEFHLALFRNQELQYFEKVDAAWIQEIFNKNPNVSVSDAQKIIDYIESQLGTVQK